MYWDVFKCLQDVSGCFRSGVSLPFYNSGMSLFRGETKSAVRCLEQHSLCYPCCSCTSCGAWQSKATQNNTKICREASNTAYACKTAKLRQSWHLWVTRFEMRYTTKRNSQKCRVSVPWGVRRADNLTLGHTSLHLETMYCTYFYHLLSTFLWKHHPRQPLALRPSLWICFHVKMWEDREVRHLISDIWNLKSCSSKRQARANAQRVHALWIICLKLME